MNYLVIVTFDTGEGLKQHQYTPANPSGFGAMTQVNLERQTINNTGGIEFQEGDTAYWIPVSAIKSVKIAPVVTDETQEGN